jgi:hypothetical protein
MFHLMFPSFLARCAIGFEKAPEFPLGSVKEKL